jgi:hypothetical protein
VKSYALRQVYAARRGHASIFYTERRSVSGQTHLCSWGDCRAAMGPARVRPDARIPAGEPHLVLTEFPGGDAGYADAAGKPVSMRICHECARMSVHADLLCPLELPLRTELTAATTAGGEAAVS